MTETLKLDLDGRVVAVTGASSGIGEATAMACADAGAAVALAARRSDRIAEVAARIQREGGRAVAIPTDVGSELQARAYLEQTQVQLGRVDVVVNAAGVMHLGPAEGAATEAWRESVHTNVMGVLYCTHAALPIMRAQASGYIVNVSSMSGRRTRAGTGVYSLTKFGVIGFSESLRQELAEHGIRVTLIEPGLVATEATMQGPLAARFKGAPAITAEDVARAILFAIIQPDSVNISELVIRPTEATG